MVYFSEKSRTVDARPLAAVAPNSSLAQEKETKVSPGRSDTYVLGTTVDRPRDPDTTRLALYDDDDRPTDAERVRIGRHVLARGRIDVGRPHVRDNEKFTDKVWQEK